VIEVQSGDAHSRHTVSPSLLRAQTHELPAGERIQLKTNVGGAAGRLRIGVRSEEFKYVVWTEWLVL